MPNQTTNYNLTKPLETERYDVQVFNNNADIIDAQMKSNADGIANVNTRLDNLNNWTTVEFTLDDFTYDENSGITYLRTEAPSGYEIEEIRGYFVLNKIEAGEAGESNNNIVMDPSIPSLNTTLLKSLVLSIPPTALAFVATPHVQINTDLLYANSDMQYTTNTDNISWKNLPTLSNFTTRSTNINHENYETTSFTLKTNVPHANISEFYGKLQYRVVPS